ncbi:MAG: putative sigma-54 modulation protein [Pseudomonadales bacterium]|jgi:putative sigma-54 modulation protein
MKIDIQAGSLSLNEDVRNSLKQRVLKRLKRFQDSIHSINLYFKDINGPKGGIDKECTVTLRVNNLEEVVISSKADSLVNAVDRSTERAKSLLARRVKKLQRQKKVNSKLNMQALVDDE